MLDLCDDDDEEGGGGGKKRAAEGGADSVAALALAAKKPKLVSTRRSCCVWDGRGLNDDVVSLERQLCSFHARGSVLWAVVYMGGVLFDGTVDVSHCKCWFVGPPLLFDPPFPPRARALVRVADAVIVRSFRRLPRLKPQEGNPMMFAFPPTPPLFFAALYFFVVAVMGFSFWRCRTFTVDLAAASRHSRDCCHCCGGGSFGFHCSHRRRCGGCCRYCLYGRYGGRCLRCR